MGVPPLAASLRSYRAQRWGFSGTQRQHPLRDSCSSVRSLCRY